MSGASSLTVGGGVLTVMRFKMASGFLLWWILIA